MKANMGTLDRAVRIIIAIVVGVLYYMGIIEGTVGYVLMALAVIFLATSFISFCPLYWPFGISTKKKSE
jgi:uncharacterized membrane protein YccC